MKKYLKFIVLGALMGLLVANAWIQLFATPIAP